MPTSSADLTYNNIGDQNMFRVLSVKSSEELGYQKTIRAMQLHNGCVLEIETIRVNHLEVLTITESTVFIPNVEIVTDINSGFRLEKPVKPYVVPR